MAGTMVGDKVYLSLSLLVLQAQFGAAMAIGTATTEENENRPEEPKPPQLVVIGAAASLPAAVTVLTHVGLIVHPGALLPRRVRSSPLPQAGAVPGLLHAVTMGVGFPSPRSSAPAPPSYSARQPLA